MKNRNKRFAQSLIFTVVAAAFLLVLSFRLHYLTVLLFAVAIVLASSLSVYSISIYSQKLFKAAFLAWVAIFAVEIVYIILSYTGYIEVFSDMSYIKGLIDGAGGWGEVIFVLISFLQVTIVPIPAAITVMAGSAIFGLWESVAYSLIGIIAGSMFAFFLGKVFGVKLVKWIVGEEMLKKYRNLSSGRDSMLIFFMLLLPLFPDDVICLVAGLTNLSYFKFFIMNLIGRPLGTIVTAALGGGNINIPFSGWGLAAWAAIGLAVVLSLYVLLKYNQAAMMWFKDLTTRKRREKFGYGNIDRGAIDKTVLEKVASTQILRTNDIFYSEPKVVLKAKRKTEKETVRDVVGRRRKNYKA